MVQKDEIKEILIKGLSRLLLIAAFSILFNTTYTRYYWKSDLDKHGFMLLELMQIQDTCDMLYLGESSNYSYHPTRDTVKDRISDMVAGYFPNKRLGTLNMAAYHGRMFLPIIDQIDEKSPVKTVIVTLNMRTFNQDVIHGELETALQKSARMYKKAPPLANRFFMAFHLYDDMEAIDRDFEMWKDWTFDPLKSTDTSIVFPATNIRDWCQLEKFPLPEGGEDMKKRGLADHYVKGYAFHITKDNPRVKDFDKMVDIANKKGFKLVFNILAENVDYADSLIGKNLVWLMQNNRDFLMNRYRAKGVIVADNLEAVGGYHYTDQNWTTEHYDETGRRIIAKNVALAIKGSL